MPNCTHASNGTSLAEDTDGTTTRAEPADETRLSDPTGRLRAVDDMPAPTDTVIGITGVRAHSGIHRCRRVLVTIDFGGAHKERRFVPTATVQAVRRWAVGVHGFDLPAEDRPDHEVGLCGTGVVADRKARVGALATRCALRLELAPTDRFRR